MKHHLQPPAERSAPNIGHATFYRDKVASGNYKIEHDFGAMHKAKAGQ